MHTFSDVRWLNPREDALDPRQGEVERSDRNLCRVGSLGARDAGRCDSLPIFLGGIKMNCFHDEFS